MWGPMAAEAEGPWAQCCGRRVHGGVRAEDAWGGAGSEWPEAYRFRFLLHAVADGSVSSRVIFTPFLFVSGSPERWVGHQRPSHGLLPGNHM